MRKNIMETIRKTLEEIGHKRDDVMSKFFYNLHYHYWKRSWAYTMSKLGPDELPF